MYPVVRRVPDRQYAGMNYTQTSDMGSISDKDLAAERHRLYLLSATFDITQSERAALRAIQREQRKRRMAPQS